MSIKPSSDANVLSNEPQAGTRDRIAAQLALVASLTPGSAEHRIATRVLLLLQDGLFLLNETDALLSRAEPRPEAEE